MPSTEVRPRASLRTLGRIDGLLALGYAALAVVAVLWLSPRVPYADTWRFDAQLLSMPFLHGILVVDNGHAQILPRLLRGLELARWHGSSWPTLLAGLACLLASVGLWWRALSTHATAAPGMRAGWILSGVLGLCWLGSARTLLHPNEAVHAYLITVCLLAGLSLVSRPGRLRLAAALLLACLAMLSFGTGAAVFAALLCALLLRRAPWSAWLATLAAAAASAALYLMLPQARAGAHVMALHPVRQTVDALRWLSGGWLEAGGPLVNAGLLDHLHGWMRAVAALPAGMLERLFGPATLAIWPEAALSLAGLAVLGWLGLRAWRAPLQHSAAERLALSTAVFAVACAALVMLGRADYFRQFPGEVYSPRFVVWSALMWSGILGAGVLRLAERGRIRMALLLPACLAILLLPSSGWMLLWGRHMQSIAERDAMALRVGVIDTGVEHGENLPDEMRRARPRLLAQRAAMFAPSQGLLPGHAPDGDIATIRLDRLRWHAVDNALGRPAQAVEFDLDSSTHAEQVFLLDRGGRMVGQALRGSDGHWNGYLLGRQQPLTALPR